MRGKLWFVGGLAVGFVLGARAGREKYEELMAKGRELLESPTVQEAAGMAQAQANRLVQQGKERLSQTKLGEKVLSGGEQLPAGVSGTTTPPSGSSATQVTGGVTGGSSKPPA
ncbi:MAG TPA: hypothetical protein VF174_07210 [Micromonosporaceae bacterium]